MGIRGLETFINAMPTLVEKIELKNCNLVLDANSIFHQSYTESGLHCIFGGEYDEFYRYCIQLFEFFRDCNIKVVVVFDGAKSNDLKMETNLSRATDRIKNSSSTDLTIELSPLLLRQVFVSVLDAFKIPYVSALGENDGECVSLANRLNAYVLARDSDYFCYDLKLGYILFNSVERSSIEGRPCLKAQLYRVDSLLKAFPGLQLSTLILACCLCGNDYLSKDLTISILRHLVRRVYMPQAIENNRNDETRHLYACMQWMRKFTHFYTALQQTCELINDTSKQIELQNKLLTIVQFYFIPPDTVIEPLRLLENFNFPINSGAYTPLLNRNENSSNIISKRGHLLPPFLCDAVSNLRLSSSFIKVLVYRGLICKAHIEVTDKPSIYEHAIPLLEPCFAILLQWDRDHANPLVYIRQRVQDRLEICPYSLKDYMNDVPELARIESLSTDERQRFVRKYFNLPNNLFQQWNHIDRNYHFWLMIIRYWYIKCNLKPVFLYGIIVCLIKNIFLRTDYRVSSVQEQINAISAAFGNGQEYRRDPSNILQRLDEMCDAVIKTSEFKFDTSIVHELNCLQAIYLYSSELNEFFNRPFQLLIHPHYFISGSLFYTFVHRYRNQDNLSDVLCKLFLRETVLIDFANNLYNCLDF